MYRARNCGVQTLPLKMHYGGEDLGGNWELADFSPQRTRLTFGFQTTAQSFIKTDWELRPQERSQTCRPTDTQVQVILLSVYHAVLLVFWQCRPIWPVGPVNPCGPGGPFAPGGPGTPRKPEAPGTPLVPVRPVAPVAPGGPAGPEIFHQSLLWHKYTLTTDKISNIFDTIECNMGWLSYTNKTIMPAHCSCQPTDRPLSSMADWLTVVA